MGKLTVEESRLKEIIKAAVVEAMLEVIEEIGMERAIKEAELTPRVDRDEIFKILEEKELSTPPENTPKKS